MTLCIAEKRDVAKKMAKVIGATTDSKDWFEGNGYCVTWCQGHLLEQRVPESEGRWSLSNLPIIPARFELAPISKGKDKEGDYIEDSSVKHRLYVIRTLMQKCDTVVCATDAGREGQLIFENVYRYIGLRKQCKRLWISSLTEKAFKEGFRNLMNNDDFQDLGDAARMRAEADWMIGINATRAFTLTANSSKPLSLGRVQTPTLCMVCQRYLENKNFKSEPFWFLDGESSKNGIPFKYRGDDRYDNESSGVIAQEKANKEGYLTVDSITTERKNDEAPLLHDLASLQKIANAKYGLTAKQTLDAAQALYEKQLLSYPRTGSRYISEDVFQEIPGLLALLTDHPVYGEAVRKILPGPLNRRSVNETKITDHHGLIITGNRPTELDITQSQVYDLVLLRFIEAFSPVCVADVTTVEFSVADVTFTSKGRREISLGWRGVGGDGKGDDVSLDEVDEVEITMTPLPRMEEGERIPIGRLELIRDVTKPKPLLTEATLLTSMQNAGRQVENKSLAKAIKGIGIGTAATRQDVIEEIVHRGYIYREKKKLIPTELGLSIYDAIKDREIANVEMSAKWESALSDIADGDRDAKLTFLSGIKEYTIEITDDIRTDGRIKAIGGQVKDFIIKCPSCGHGIRIGEKGGRCECGFGAWRTISSKSLTDEQMKQLYEKGRTGTIQGFKAKNGSSFSAALALSEGKLSFIFPENVSENAIKCPKCGSAMRFSEKSLWCPSCRFAVWREVSHKKLSDKQLEALVIKGRTGKISGFVSKAGRPFEAVLVLQDDGKVKFE